MESHPDTGWNPLRTWTLWLTRAHWASVPSFCFFVLICFVFWKLPGYTICFLEVCLVHIFFSFSVILHSSCEPWNQSWWHPNCCILLNSSVSSSLGVRFIHQVPPPAAQSHILSSCFLLPAHVRVTRHKPKISLRWHTSRQVWLGMSPKRQGHRMGLRNGWVAKDTSYLSRAPSSILSSPTEFCSWNCSAGRSDPLFWPPGALHTQGTYTGRQIHIYWFNKSLKRNRGM